MSLKTQIFEKRVQYNTKRFLYDRWIFLSMAIHTLYTLKTYINLVTNKQSLKDFENPKKQ